jgi:predicted methyltransferase
MKLKPILSHYQTRPLAENKERLEMPFSTDLGLTTSLIKKSSEGWVMPDGLCLTFDQVAAITAEENSCFLFDDEGIHKAEAFSPFTNRYYSLMPTPRAPTMLISGIPMHRIKGTTPDKDTTWKIKALGKPYGNILDTATGLGYTAIQAARTAAQVVTVEFDPAVITLCRMNPWSQELFTNPRIVQVIADSADFAQMLAPDSVNAIIHDPPMFNLAGHLYSGALYEIFYNILKQNGRMFHYIGNPDSRLGASVGRGVVNRLRQAGFSVTPKPKAFGVLAQK